MSRLVLTRRPGEAILIGDNVVVTIGRIKAGQVQILIDAPIDVTILRNELLEYRGRDVVITVPVKPESAYTPGDEG